MKLQEMICVVTGAGGDTGPAIVDILSRECKSVVAVVRGNVDSWKESVEIGRAHV